MSDEITSVETTSDSSLVTSDVFDTIRNLHEKVSMEDTPKSQVKKKFGLD